MPNPVEFTGAMLDSSSGLYKMGERYYDPGVGRFTQAAARVLGSTFPHSSSRQPGLGIGPFRALATCNPHPYIHIRDPPREN